MNLYTDEKNVQILIALLKSHGIRKVVANPGKTNIAFVGSIQNDAWFQLYSGIDERHSAYMAVGMAAESKEPVVLSCTGATASRNYLPALTEAYYRKIPILAVTSMQNFDNIGQLSPQALDRSRVPADAVFRSFDCRIVKDAHDEAVCVRRLNEAILELRRRGGGPVHVNLETTGACRFGTGSLPNVRLISRFETIYGSDLPKIPDHAKVALLMGSGTMDPVWETFAASHNVSVFADVGSEYHGPKLVRASLLCSQVGFSENPKYADLKPDLIIHVGEVSGDYPVVGYLVNKAPVWRVSPDGEVRDTLGRLENVFEMSPREFVSAYTNTDPSDISSYFDAWKRADGEIRSHLPDLPFSNPWIAHRLSQDIPEDASVHFGILNSLRSWNLFPARDAVRTYANVGGFGIDGCVSTLVGASLASPDTVHFGIFGDLAFFYDLNALGNRHIGKNLRILLVNNGCGTEFNLSIHPGSQFGARTNDFIAAGGHFGNKSRQLVRHFAEDLGFRYLSASGKTDFEEVISEFLSKDASQSVILECFTDNCDESKSHQRLYAIDSYVDRRSRFIRSAKQMVPQRLKNAIKELTR